jgi:hypothetical protein
MTRLTRSLGVRPGGGPLVILVAGLERSDAAAVRRGRAISLDDAVAYVIATFEGILAEAD